jgi:short-subunit dehydrogenase
MEESRPVALVVGATGGIGSAVAAALADQYTVWLAGRNETALHELAETLPSADCWTIDLSSGRGLSEPPPQLSTLSLLVHCAGSFALGTICNTPVDI